MGKLVRDRIPEIISAEGRTPRVRRLDDDKYVIALFDKLSEEADELRAASPADRLSEAADVYEVLLAVLALDGYEGGDLVQAAKAKHEVRGGFAERWYWEPDV